MNLLALSPSSTARFGIGRAFVQFVKLVSSKASVKVLTRSEVIAKELDFLRQDNVIKAKAPLDIALLPKLLGSADVVVSFVRWYLPYVAIAKKVVGRKIPVVFSYHSPPPHKKKLGLQISFSLADKVAVPSKWMKTEVEKRYKVKCEVIPNAIDVKRMKSYPPLLPKSDKKRICYVATPQKRKNPEIFFEVAGILGERFEWFFAGMTEKELSRFCTKEIPPFVKILGWLSHKDVIGLFKSCDVAVFPYENEPFGLAVAEAMAVGTAVVCLRSGALPEIVEDAGILCEEKSAIKFAEAVRMAVEQSDILGKKAIEKVKKFSPDKVA